MAAEISAGPPCDICGAEPGIASLMNYTDYSQVRFGPACGPAFLRSIAAAMAGEPEPEPVIEPDPPAAEQVQQWTEQTAALDVGDHDDAPEQGSARDHWASTTNVRRSTHGHRTPRGATGKPREADPE